MDMLNPTPSDATIPASKKKIPEISKQSKNRLRRMKEANTVRFAIGGSGTARAPIFPTAKDAKGRRQKEKKRGEAE